MAHTSRPSSPFFARSKVQFWTFTVGACLETCNALRMASRGDHGGWFWFYVASTVFFLVMTSLVLWQHHRDRQSSSDTSARW